MQKAVELKNIQKYFGDYHAVNDVSFQIEQGAFFSLLGPSGCGKTSLLRMISGLETVSSGEILFDGKSVLNTPIEERNVGMVFQNYALFPHMRVYDNIAYGLKIKKTNPDIMSDAVQHYLKLMNLVGLENRLPHELSGGQQQRVALARALITQPFLLLLDEPLSNLDVKLREEIREELMRIKLETNITTVYVTHDQSEALYLADQIAVMKTGVVQQLDNSKTIYHRPTNEYVANFVGETNIIPSENISKVCSLTTEAKTYSLRPDSINFTSGDVSVEGTVKESQFYGMISSATIEVPALQMDLKVFYFSRINDNKKSGDAITLYFNQEDLVPMSDN